MPREQRAWEYTIVFQDGDSMEFTGIRRRTDRSNTYEYVDIFGCHYEFNWDDIRCIKAAPTQKE